MRLKKILFSFIPILVLFSCKPPAWKVKSAKNLTNSNETISSKDPEIESWLNTYKDSVNKLMSKVIANTQDDLLSARSRGKINQETENQANLGRIAADYVQQAADNYMLSQYGSLSHFTVLNHMGLRNSIFKGDITLGKVFEVMPFDNELVVLQLTGSQCDSLFNFIAQLGGSPISSLELTNNDTTYTDVKVRGLNFDSRKTYFVATSDFLLGGGDNFIMLKHPKKIIKTGLLIRDVLIEGFQNEFKQTGKIDPRSISRIHHISKKN
jgi:2',3'-cyclic-nucleotide 2'-phosphodiesterase (5'-nucleotidase family)